MTTEKPPSALARAERTSRRVTLIVGAGVVSFIVGSLGTAGVVRRLAPWVASIESQTLVLLATGILQSLWVLAPLPVSGWLAGRFLEIQPWRFAVPAALSGLAFDVLLSTAVFGADSLFVDQTDALFRSALMLLGIGTTMLATRAGAQAFARAQAQSKAVAEANRAQYEAFIKGDP
jgi:hypothetical protein